MDKLKQKWRSLQQREKTLLILCAIFISVLLLFYTLFNPLNQAASNAQSDYTYQQNLMTWMQPRVRALQGIKTPQSTVQVLSQAELLPTIDSRLKTTTFASTVQQVTQANSNGVRITFKNVPFDDLLTWLISQWQTSRITVSDIDVQKGNKVGLTDVNLTLMLAVA